MDLFETMLQHTSVRAFAPRKLATELKKQLILAAQSGSSSNFVQAYSIIEITDETLLKEIEIIANAPGYITGAGVFYLFVADLYKHHQLLESQGLTSDHLQTMEPFIVSVVDTTIAAQSMAVFAESEGLGICYIGGIRNDLFRIAELLDLPRYTFPLFGMSLGYPAFKNEVKQRLPYSAIVSQNRYVPVTSAEFEAYDQETTRYYASRSRNQQETNWSSKMIEFFSEARRPEVAAFMKKQGFLLR